MIDAEDLTDLLRGEFSSLSIGFNDDHACNYVHAKDWDCYGDEKSRIDWVSGDEKRRALENNSVWTIQWYPDTPVGFYCVAASTFEAAARFALETHGNSK